MYFREGFNNIEVRLHRFYIAKALCNDLVSFTHLKAPLKITDLSMINMKIKFPEIYNKQIGPGFWK